MNAIFAFACACVCEYDDLIKLIANELYFQCSKKKKPGTQKKYNHTRKGDACVCVCVYARER